MIPDPAPSTSQLSFADQERASRREQRGASRATTRLRAIAAFVDWPSLEALLPGLDHRTANQQRRGGRPRYSERVLLRLLFLQYLFDLSDPELEDQVLDRESFQEFAGITSSQPVPDFTTLWRFKELLATRGTLDQLFAQVGAMLEARGLVLKRGTIVDATVVASTHRPLTHEARETLLEREAATGHRDRYRDSDAMWTAKRNSRGQRQYYYGYKGHIGIDAGSRLIRQVDFSPANCSDIAYYRQLLSGDEHAIYGDRAYHKQQYRQEAEARALEGRPVRYAVMRKGDRYHALSAKDIAFNRSVHRVRCQVEHAFAAMKGRLSLRAMPAIGLPRNRLRFVMNCLLYNIERAIAITTRRQAIPITG